MEKTNYITFRAVFDRPNLCAFIRKFAIPYTNKSDLLYKLAILSGMDNVKYIRHNSKTISKDRYVMEFNDFLMMY